MLSVKSPSSWKWYLESISSFLMCLIQTCLFPPIIFSSSPLAPALTSAVSVPDPAPVPCDLHIFPTIKNLYEK